MHGSPGPAGATEAGRPGPSASQAGSEEAKAQSQHSKRALAGAPHRAARGPRFPRVFPSAGLLRRVPRRGAEPGPILGQKKKKKKKKGKNRGPAFATEAAHNGPRPRGEATAIPGPFTLV